jgi:hypothetical protein
MVDFGVGAVIGRNKRDGTKRQSESTSGSEEAPHDGSLNSMSNAGIFTVFAAVNA